MADIKKIRLSGQTYNIVDENAIHNGDGYWTSAQTQNAITAATDALATAIAEEGYQNATQVQTAIDSSITGKVDTTAFTSYTSATESVLATKFAGAVWNASDKKIYFYDNASNTGTALAYIDGTDFVKDGFLESVTIENRTISGESVPCLVFVWNTDSGLQETDIPLGDLFDPSNYVDYTTFNTYTAATQTAIGNKADQTALTAHTADTTAHTTSAEKAAWNAKQDALVSGTNIKTVGTNSLLGSGNIALMTASIGSGNDNETLIFDFA